MIWEGLDMCKYFKNIFTEFNTTFSYIFFWILGVCISTYQACRIRKPHCVYFPDPCSRVAPVNIVLTSPSPYTATPTILPWPLNNIKHFITSSSAILTFSALRHGFTFILFVIYLFYTASETLVRSRIIQTQVINPLTSIDPS